MIGAPLTNAQDTTAPITGQAETMRADLRSARENGRTRDGRGQTSIGEIFRGVFDAADADGNDTVTPTEIDAYRAAQLAEVDASGDGALNIEEFDTFYRSVTRSRMVDLFQEIDADGDGQIAPDEIDRSLEGLVSRLDRDGDGTLTLLRRGQSAPPE
ncbi:hypothetical protein BWR18_15345 [Tateyamaria omphalii]|uniref:EF-hand domain-containing protein n=1 Tax=Tateyamaria omphalii TaxID=299262 RepID=A0A1P8MXU1_9RHOB|nr:hypothetical protein BWR18_15345 [Tateyamaria omphalii]